MSGFLVAAVICATVGFILYIWAHRGSKDILKMFRSGNVIVAGHKGRGKDLLFQYVIAAREKDGERHAANIRFTEKTIVHPINYYGLKSNTKKNFICGNFEPEQQTFTEKEDFYISDAGVALPATSHNELEKTYPTLPIVYALSRHLGKFNIHANAQDYYLIWDKLRVQADYFIWCERAKVYFGRYAVQRVVLYDRAETAFEHIQPYKVKRSLILRRASKEDLAAAHSFNAKYGLVKRTWFWHKLPKDGYDTRAFYGVLYRHKPIDVDEVNKARRRAKKNKKKTG